MTIQDARQAMAPYFNEDGMITTDLDHEDGNDSPHKTGMYYMGMCLAGACTSKDINSFLNALDTLTTKDGRLLRHKNSRLQINGHRRYWQEANRDQYTSIMGALALMKDNASADDKRKEIWQLMKRSDPLFLTGDDINPKRSDHWLYFARCGGENLGYCKRLFSDAVFTIGSLITIVKTRRATKNIKPGSSPFSAAVLRIAKSYIMINYQPTFLSKFNHWMLGKLLNKRIAFDFYFSKTWDVEPDPPVHMMWREVWNKENQ